MAASSERHPPTKRIAAAELMRESDLTAEAIAAKIGVPYATVCRWNQFYNWRPWVRRTPPAVDPLRWSAPRLAALERVYRLPSVDPGDLAQAVGTERRRWRAFFRACGFAERAERVPEEAPDDASLRVALRGHLARVIVDLDAELCLRRSGPAETARMLRDLATLKKLVEEIEPAVKPGERRPRSGRDLDALRADIWHRYVAFARDRLGREASEEEIVLAAEAAFEKRILRYAPSARRCAAVAPS